MTTDPNFAIYNLNIQKEFFHPLSNFMIMSDSSSITDRRNRSIDPIKHEMNTISNDCRNDVAPFRIAV